MPIPNNTCLGILSHPNGECTSISEVVCNVNTGNQSLYNLNMCAGLQEPYSLLNFRNYDNFVITPIVINDISYLGGEYDINIKGPSPITYIFTDSDNLITEVNHPVLSPNGIKHTLCIPQNNGSNRIISVKYKPSFGDVIGVHFNQNAGNYCPVYYSNLINNSTRLYQCKVEKLCGIQYGECANVTFFYAMQRNISTANNLITIVCNSRTIFSCCICGSNSCYITQLFGPINYKYGDVICGTTRACVPTDTRISCSVLQIDSISNVIGTYCIGTPNCSVSSIPSI